MVRAPSRKGAQLDEDIAHARERLAGVEIARGPISVRKMFGGAGLYIEGRIFAVIVDGALLLKGDTTLGRAFEAAGGARWRYDGKTKPVAMPYWSPPPDALDDDDALCDWALRSIAASRSP